MKLKKIITLFLACVFLSQTAFAAPADVSKAALLDKLGVTSDISEDKSEKDYITRAEFISCIMKILGTDTEESKNAGYFIDVPPEYKYSGAVNAAYEQGIISGMYDGFFVPDALLKAEQCAGITVSLTGYDAIAKSLGGWPDGYLRAAENAGIFSGGGIAKGGFVTYAQAVSVLYNMLNTDMAFVNIENGSEVIKTEKGSTVLENMMNLEKMSGKVTGTERTSLETADGAGKGKIEIDGRIYDYSSDDAEEYIGCDVDYWYSAGDAEVAAIIPKKYVDFIKVDAEDIEDYENYKYTYLDGSRTRSREISPKTMIIYNGRLVTDDYSKVNYKPYAGDVTFVDGDGDGKYEILKITSYSTVVVNGISAEDYLITDKYDVLNNIEIEDIDDVFLSVCDAEKNEIGFSGIGDDNIISAAISIDKKVYDILVSDDTSEVKVKSVSKQSDDLLIVTDEGDFYAAGDVIGFLDINSGDNGILYIDAFGKAAYFKADKSGQYRYGYLKAVYYDDVEDKLTAKILDSDGVFGKITTDTTVDVNKDRKVDAKGAYEFLKDSEQLVLYKTNSQNVLTKIQTADEGMLRSLYSSGSGSGLKYWSSSHTFDAKVPVSDSATVFVLPQDGAKYSSDFYYTAKKRAYLANGSRYVFDTFNSDDKSDFADAVIVYKSYNTPVVDQGIALVKSVDATVNEDDEIVSNLTILYMGAEFEFETAEQDTVQNARAEDGTSSGIEIAKGDVIRFALDPNDRIDDIKVVFDRDAGKYMGNPTSSQLDAQYRSVFGSVYSTEDKIAKIYVNENPIVFSPTAMHNTEFYPIDKFKIYVCDETSSKMDIYIGNENDIADYKHYGQKYSRVVVQTKNGEPAAMVVYKTN